MGATALLCPIRKITQNQINQSVINIVIALGLIMMSFLMMQFNPVFGVVSLILLTLVMVYQVKIGSLNFSDVEEKGEYSMFISGVLIVIGIILLVYGSKFFVNGAVNIATTYGIPESVIGVSLVAFGTSLPELAVGVLSAVRKRVDFALGNVLGSNIYNVLGVLGVSSFFGRFEFPPHIASFDLYVMTGVIIFITFYMVAMKKLGRLYGVLSLLVYTFYIGYMYI
jgi:cation:H+ antiporter